MRRWTWLAFGLALAATAARGADYKTLRNLNAGPPTQVAPAGAASVQTVQFARIILHPRDGKAWALAYSSTGFRYAEDGTPNFRFLTWQNGAAEADLSGFQRIFDEELKKAGFKSDSGDSLFGEGASSANLKVGVLVDDISGRFCLDCPNPFNRQGIPATVTMNANWEIYSALDRKVVARVATVGGANYNGKLQDSVLPAVFEGFRENVRQLLAGETFRKAVAKADPVTFAAAPQALMTPIRLAPGAVVVSLSEATNSTAVVFASDGSGSGFLISGDGYLLTNHHVVGGSKYVKVKWNDGSEAVGEVVRSDPRRDVALVKVDGHGRGPLSLRHDPARQGEGVYAIGSPLGETYQNTMTKGIVSATRVENGLPLIQSDVAITHGNSGGPLLDEKGQVIGLSVSGMMVNGAPLNLNFFIPIEDALRALALTPAPADSPQVAAAPPKAPAARKR